MFYITLLPHTADLCFHLEADTYDELFQGGLQIMSGVLKEGFCQEQQTYVAEINIETLSSDRTTLLIDFLSDILTESHTEKIVFCILKIDVLQNNFIKASVRGNKVDGFDEDIKAVTYHEAEVIQNDQNMWETRLIFDI